MLFHFPFYFRHQRRNWRLCLKSTQIFFFSNDIWDFKSRLSTVNGEWSNERCVSTSPFVWIVSLVTIKVCACVGALKKVWWNGNALMSLSTAEWSNAMQKIWTTTLQGASCWLGWHASIYCLSIILITVETYQMHPCRSLNIQRCVT